MLNAKPADLNESSSMPLSFNFNTKWFVALVLYIYYTSNFHQRICSSLCLSLIKCKHIAKTKAGLSVFGQRASF